MRIRKIIIALLCVFTLVTHNSINMTAMAANPKGDTVVEFKEKYVDAVQPMVDWSGNVYVSSSEWCNVTSSNNIFRDRPTVTNGASSPGGVYVRVINSKGEVVVSSTYIASGSSKKLSTIPALSGVYTLQAKAQITSGTYYISID